MATLYVTWRGKRCATSDDSNEKVKALYLDNKVIDHWSRNIYGMMDFES